MSSNQVAVLKRHKEILEEVLDLAECQPGLLRAGRAEDLEILLSLRARPLSQLADLEKEADAAMAEPGTGSTQDLYEISELNAAILTLVDRIIDADEKTESLCEHYHDFEESADRE